MRTKLWRVYDEDESDAMKALAKIMRENEHVTDFPGSSDKRRKIMDTLDPPPSEFPRDAEWYLGPLQAKTYRRAKKEVGISSEDLFDESKSRLWRKYNKGKQRKKPRPLPSNRLAANHRLGTIQGGIMTINTPIRKDGVVRYVRVFVEELESESTEKDKSGNEYVTNDSGDVFRVYKVKEEKINDYRVLDESPKGLNDPPIVSIDFAFQTLQNMKNDEDEDVELGSVVGNNVFRLQQRGDKIELLVINSDDEEDRFRQEVKLEGNEMPQGFFDTDMIFDNGRIWRLAPLRDSVEETEEDRKKREQAAINQEARARLFKKRSEVLEKKDPKPGLGHKKKPKGNPMSAQMTVIVTDYMRNPTYDNHVPCRFDPDTAPTDILACRPLLNMSKSHIQRCRKEVEIMRRKKRARENISVKESKSAEVCRRSLERSSLRDIVNPDEGIWDRGQYEPSMPLADRIRCLWRLAVTKDVLKGRVKIYWNRPLVGTSDESVRSKFTKPKDGHYDLLVKASPAQFYSMLLSLVDPDVVVYKKMTASEYINKCQNEETEGVLDSFAAFAKNPDADDFVLVAEKSRIDYEQRVMKGDVDDQTLEFGAETSVSLDDNSLQLLSIVRNILQYNKVENEIDAQKLVNNEEFLGDLRKKGDNLKVRDVREIVYHNIERLMSNKDVKLLCSGDMPIFWKNRIDTNRTNNVSHPIEYGASDTYFVMGVDRVINGKLYKRIKNIKNQALSSKLKNMFSSRSSLFQKCGYLNTNFAHFTRDPDYIWSNDTSRYLLFPLELQRMMSTKPNFSWPKMAHGRLKMHLRDDDEDTKKSMDQFVRAVFRIVFGVDTDLTEVIEIKDYNEQGQYVGTKEVEIEIYKSTEFHVTAFPYVLGIIETMRKAFNKGLEDEEDTLPFKFKPPDSDPGLNIESTMEYQIPGQKGMIPNLKEVILYFEGNWGGRIFANDILRNGVPSSLNIRQLVPRAILEHPSVIKDDLCETVYDAKDCLVNREKLAAQIKPCQIQMKDDDIFNDACNLEVTIEDISPFESRGINEDLIVPIDRGQLPPDDIFLQ